MLALLLIARLGAIAALIFLICTVILVLRSPGRTLAEARHNILLWLVAGWSLLTVLWSAYPDLTLRYGIQLCITMAFGIALASRLSILTFVRLMAWTYGLIAIAGLLFGRVRSDGLGWLGLFNSKNIFAGASGFLVIACLAIALDVRQPGRHRALAGAGMALGLFLVMKGQSVGVTLAMIVALTGMIILMALRRVTRVARVLASTVSALALVFLLLTILSYSSEFAALMMDVTGKDVTLTGRTYLWEIAFDEIARAPWLGQGFQAFWVVGNTVAEDLWLEFGIATKIGFHFHNTAISNTVEIGLIGTILQTVTFGLALVYILYRALMDPRAETIFLAGIMLRQLVLSMSEVVYFSQFDPTTVLTVAAVTYAGRLWRENPAQPGASRGDGLGFPAIRENDGALSSVPLAERSS
jgi:exopolysaccharide production protein ExoQ